ncbi:response regulator [Carboxylicivirga sp. RSCT41]|uniref:response regulator n=1 Tax=Carboxylicivirga agarovorans TaxID=3417570 RepID=UPI003D356457
MKILIVDDAKDARMIGKYMLKDFSVEVIEACNGLEAWPLIIREKPDVILLDLEMPLMDGYEVMEELIKEAYSIPTLVMTSHNSIQVKELCYSLGAQAFFPKPISLKLFRNTFFNLNLVD